jgi:hypothetical protein
MTLEYVDTILAFTVVMLLLSLLITVLVQLVISIFNLRGGSLLWGVEQILKSCPELQNYSKTIAEKILKHRSIAPGKRLAKAIGSKEMKSIIMDVYKDLDRQTSNNNNNKNAEEEKKIFEAIKKALSDSFGEEVKDNTEKIVKQFEELFPEEVNKIIAAVHLLEKNVTGLILKIDTWFETVMRRTTERFTMMTRVWTVVFAVIVTIGFNVDSRKLLLDLSTDAGLRETLASSANQVLGKAEAVLNIEPIATKALMAIKGDLPENIRENIPDQITNIEDGADWLKQHVKDREQQKKVLDNYRLEYDKLARERLGTVMEQAKGLRADLEEARLTIGPGKWPWQNWRGWPHLFGLLMTIAFLSLGAPFWFNALRGISNLRPLLAGRVDPSKQEDSA